MTHDPRIRSHDGPFAVTSTAWGVVPDGTKHFFQLRLGLEDLSGEDVPLKDVDAVICQDNDTVCDYEPEGTITFEVESQEDCHDDFDCLTSFSATLTMTSSAYFVGTMELGYGEVWVNKPGYGELE